MDPIFLAGAIVIMLFSIILHEVMHGFAALQFGDTTARDMGRLTLNPIPHIDPIGSIALPLLLYFAHGPIIGWAKPVPVNPLRFSNIKKGELVVALAGVTSNLVLAVLAALIYHLIPNLQPSALPDLLRFTFSINLVLAIFNLIPIPPLDGSKVLMTILPYHLARQFEKLSPYGMFILIISLYVPVLGVPIISLILGIVLFLFSSIFQIPPKFF